MQCSGRLYARGRDREQAIHLLGRLDRPRVDGNDRIHAGAAVVVGLDAIEVMTDHLRARHLLRIERGVNAADRCFVEEHRDDCGLNHGPQYRPATD